MHNTNQATRPPWYYVWIIAAAKPIYRWIVYRKSHHKPTYQAQVQERFGKGYIPSPKSTPNALVIWCHAVSLGEINTAYPLLKILLQRGFCLWITSTTQTGFDRVKVLFAEQINNQTVSHSFVPVDDLATVRRFLGHVRPVMAVFVETELWANTLYELKNRKISSVMINARLTQKSFDGYARFGKISRSMMDNLSYIIAQDTASVRRFLQLGIDEDRICQMDSLKWASFAKPSINHKKLLESVASQLADRPVWVAASTHDTEEALVLQAHKMIRKKHPDALLIIVPRHPERFNAVAGLCYDSGFDVARRSLDEMISHKTAVYLADSMGELMVWYALADVALVAGSFLDMGGHNPIEPASLGKPIIMGKFVKNCETLVESLAAAHALVQADDACDVAAFASDWFSDKQKASRAGQAAKQLVCQNSDIAQRMADKLLAVLMSEYNQDKQA
ncbi:3-deoxy-D-manno-octulosonic acid transferase [Moraxella nasovis]|uniref:3-deoxy-D-manno-octulosonic acid transferase n=1 Tax=Moraxella nasovis TaxID=2904121 RepID=UPI001F6036BA|nr:3-deoxy-D-manno-octulosonic acid transferase [Moraxella nasovis]UNU73680.1 3-deoxy-D-manno-octulosonic acid transferase [Moraxella nasovis]